MLICENHENTIQWKAGERLENIFENRCDKLESTGKRSHPATVAEDVVLSYRELDNRANQLARYLRKRGIKSGDRIGLLFDKSFHTYIALLAVLKVNAAYVPLDPSFPVERVSFIVDDARINAFISLSKFQPGFQETSQPVIYLDRVADEVALERRSRLEDHEKDKPVDQLCYIIYTSGSTGNPKGVAIEHSSICNFVRVARKVYGITEEDRVYQGMTIAFDFSVEELWIPLASGATLVPGKADSNLVGNDLAAFLSANRVTAMCCVPTLLATIEDDLPDLRFLLVSGEACPHDLVARWHRPGRTILNAYGPTEATVTATWSEPHPDKPMTIGGPLPTYSIVILDENQEEVPKGQAGEICIAGIGLAKGYVNRDDLTQKTFIPDFLDIPNNPSKRIYRTGDLGRVTDENEIEYLGRIDTQVKIRGYRIELTEIESVLLQVPKIAQAVVSTHSTDSGIDELVAYCVLTDREDELPVDAISETLRAQLPAYMIPAFIEKVPNIPMLPSNKADRKKLPAPRGPRFVSRDTAFVAPKSMTEKILENVLTETLKIDRVSATDNFFEDLGAHSLLMAQYCTKLRDHLVDRDVSMSDIYLHPTIAGLARNIESRAEVASHAVPENHRVPGTLEYYGCGVLQLLSYGAYSLFWFWVGIQGLSWISAGTTWLDLYVRVAVFAVLVFAFMVAFPIAMKWIVVGRWKVETIPIWSLHYFRFWAIKWLVSNNPMMLFKGLPLFNVYLRLLGAKVGKHVVLDAKKMPVCTDLLCIEDGALVRKDTYLLGYKARAGYIYTGPTNIGKNAFVGEGSVLDIHAVMEQDTQLGHVSSLQENQVVPAGKHYHGSPAVETSANYCSVEPKECTTLRRSAYSAVQLLNIFILGPVVVASTYYATRHWTTAGDEGSFLRTFGDWVRSLNLFDLAGLSLLLFLCFILLGALFVAIVPRILNLFLQEDRVYVLYGVHFWIAHSIRILSNSKFLNLLFGDSSAIVYYLRLIGYDLSDRIIQSGSNFGVEQKHDNPHLCSVGTGTMVADGMSMINVQMSSSSFKVQRTSIGAYNYLGNDIFYPPDGKTGRNCLLATKVMIPIEGEVLEDIGLLGSPSFRIPRVVDRDRDLSQLSSDLVRQERLHRKNMHNLVTALSFLFWRWLFVFASLVISYAATQLFATMGVISFYLAFMSLAVAYIFMFISIERTSMAIARLRPQIASIYDKDFWRVERYWKHAEERLRNMFVGTPFKNVITRLCGARIGKKVFDDGLGLSEKGMVEIGDYCTFNAGCGLQSHSLEEGVFKCDYIKAGVGCTVGVNALVHYGTTIEDNAVIDPDSFLMKGETAEAMTVWRGNPAKRI